MLLGSFSIDLGYFVSENLIHYFKHNYALIQIYLFLISTLEMYLIIQVKIN